MEDRVSGHRALLSWAYEDFQCCADAGETEEEKMGRLLEEEAASLAAGKTISPEVLEEWLKWERYRERCKWTPFRLSLAESAGRIQYMPTQLYRIQSLKLIS